ncbi:MAG: hypothetical protein QXD04_05935 [Candidatus Bathyarchaeia archaeon]
MRSIRDLVMLVASSPSMNVIQHFESGGVHIYFIIGGTMSEVFLFFVREDKPLPGSFIIYNNFSGDISYSDRLRTDHNIRSIPIVEVSSQDIIPPDQLSRVLSD